ncbi:MAG: fluoride efflux transporter CrcB [Coriobacteriia bacterium]|nr:fluoride efflux transporter CrcB [Coriobacteriia bacterium]
MAGWLAVAGGGAIGAMLRYGVTLALSRPGAVSLPWHTLGVNVLGSLLLGLLMALLPADQSAEQWRLFLGLGVLGGFTTFSTFSYETLSLVQHGAWGTGALYVFASVVASILGAGLGYALGRAL